MTTALLFFVPILHGRSELAALGAKSSGYKQFDVKIIARGSSAAGGLGNMDSYLVLVSERRAHSEAAAARLVHYYPGYEAGISNERIMSGHALHLRLSAASYCRMDAKDFVVRYVFDADALARARETGEPNPLPCFIVRE